MKKLLLLLGLFTGVAAFSQTDNSAYDTGDFLIKNNGDTVKGIFKYMSSGDIKNKVTCRVNDTLKLTIKASDIKYFKEGDNEYINFQPPNEEAHYLLKIWFLGPYLELYEWQVPSELSGGNKTEYIPYVRKKGDKDFVELYHTDWKKTLPEVIADDEQLADDVWKGKYGMNQLKEIVTKYNEWKADNK